MKYLAVLDDAFLSNFRLDDEDKLTLVVTDKYGSTRAVRLKPLVTHALTTEEGESVYLTKGHIDAMKKYENTQHMLDYIQHIDGGLKLTDDTLEFVGYRTLNACAPNDIKKLIGADCKTCERDKYCPHYLPVSAVRRYGCRWYEETKGGKTNEEDNV